MDPAPETSDENNSFIITREDSRRSALAARICRKMVSSTFLRTVVSGSTPARRLRCHERRTKSLTTVVSTGRPRRKSSFWAEMASCRASDWRYESWVSVMGRLLRRPRETRTPRM